MKRYHLAAVWMMFVGMATGPDYALADDVADVSKLADEFERARTSADADAMRQLTFPDARWIVELAKDSTPIVEDIRELAKREGRSISAPGMIAERKTVIHGDSAIVSELVREDAGAGTPPTRRILHWGRDGETWRLAHAQFSPYLRWDSSISDFEAADKAGSPPAACIVFIGSSSIRMWRSLDRDFPDVDAINRGFGGSQMIDSVLFAKRVVTPYKPAGVAVYAGDNDIGRGKDAERVLQDFQSFVSSIHDELPDAKIGFIAIKPSLKRWNLWPEMKRANEMVASFADQDSRIEFLDIATPMLGEDGTPRKELFAKDGLHLNEDGYAVWTEAVKPWVDETAASKRELAASE